LRSRGYACLDGTVRALTRGRRSETLEVSTPTRLYARGIAKILLVEFVEKIGVAAVERCGFEHAEAAKNKGIV
jgi:hypothetical protein